MRDGNLWHLIPSARWVVIFRKKLSPVCIFVNSDQFSTWRYSNKVPSLISKQDVLVGNIYKEKDSNITPAIMSKQGMLNWFQWERKDGNCFTECFSMLSQLTTSCDFCLWMLIRTNLISFYYWREKLLWFLPKR